MTTELGKLFTVDVVSVSYVCKDRNMCIFYLGDFSSKIILSTDVLNCVYIKGFLSLSDAGCI